MKLFSKIRDIFQVLIPSMIFNFHYLPFKQAVRLPILLKKPNFRKLEGKVIIDNKNIHQGMIRLGFNISNVYPDSGISWLNEGTIIFKGTAQIGSDSYIVVRQTGSIEFGDDFLSTAATKIVSCIGISFGQHTLIGWSVTIIDTDFHPLYDIDKARFNDAYGKIEIGDCNWISTQCMIMHSVHTPENCVFGARSVLTHNRQYESYCVYAGSPVHVVKRNTIRKIGQDLITNYE